MATDVIPETPSQGEGLGITRRGFLKTTAAAGVLAATGMVATSVLDDSAYAETDDNDEIFVNQCRVGCVTGCPLYVHVRDGKVVKTEPADAPDPVYKRACLRGLSHAQVMYSENRVKYPMKRKERGSDEWERISWEQAIDEIGDKLLQVKEQYGAKANAMISNGGNTSLLCGPYGGLGRFRNAFEMQSIDNCVDFGCMPALERVYGKTGGYGDCNEPADLENANTFFVWSCNLTTTFWDRWQHMMRAIDKGAKLVVIDPVYTPIAAKADKYVSIRPGSDGALIMAMINYGIENELLDYDFIKKATVGPYLVKEDGKFLRMSDLGVEPTTGEPNPLTGVAPVIDPVVLVDKVTGKEGTETDVTNPAITGQFVIGGHNVRPAFDLMVERASQYPVEFAAEATDISEEGILELCRLYFEGGTVANMLGFGTNAYDSAPYMGHAFASLVVLSGQIGKPGTNAAYNNLNGFSANALFMFPEMRNMGAPSMPLLDLPEIMESGSLDLPTGTFIAPKTLWVTMINPYNNFLNTQAWTEMMPKFEMVVVVDRVFSDTARYMADYVLPAAHYFEAYDMRPNIVSAPYTCIAEKAADPLHESKTDWQIYQAFADKLGFGEFFAMSEEEAMREAFTGDFDQLKNEKLVRYREPGTYAYDYQAGLTTPTGRFEFYCEAPADRLGVPLPEELFEDNCLPTFKEPTEAWPTAAGSDEYPYVLFTMRSRGLLHSQFGDVEWLREIHPGPTVFMNPQDAAAEGIEDASFVKLSNDRGFGVAKVVISDGQRRGYLTWPKGWEQRFYEDGNLHQLTPITYNPVTKNHSYCDCHVKIEKWEGQND